MSKTLFEEAITDARHLREAAEENAKKAIVEAVTPRIRDFIEQHLVGGTASKGDFLSEAFDLDEEEAEKDEEAEKECFRAPVSASMKKAFREVAKKTHPDICGSTNLSGIWMKASEAHDSGDIAAMSSICESLGIEMSIGEEEMQMLRSSISSAKERISFIESTFSWNWMREQDSAKKEALLKEFIARKVR